MNEKESSAGTSSMTINAFEVLLASQRSAIMAIATAITAIDETLEEDGRYVKANTDEHKKISEFFQHCCQMDHYTFDVLKCGKDPCKLYKPFRLPRGVFMPSGIYHSQILVMMDTTAPLQRSWE